MISILGMLSAANWFPQTGGLFNEDQPFGLSLGCSIQIPSSLGYKSQVCAVHVDGVQEK